MYIKPKVHTSFPLAANANGATWVVGYTTGMATASYFGDAWKVKNGPDRTLRQRQVLPVH